MDEETFKATLLLAGWRLVGYNRYRLPWTRYSCWWNPPQNHVVVQLDMSTRDTEMLDKFEYLSFNSAIKRCVKLSQESSDAN